MTITPTTFPAPHQAAPPRPTADRGALQSAAEMLLLVMSEADLDPARWGTAGPLVTAAAEQLRKTVGAPVTGNSVSAPAVVREADFAHATRALLLTDSVVDLRAAGNFLRLAHEAALALA